MPLCVLFARREEVGRSSHGADGAHARYKAVRVFTAIYFEVLCPRIMTLFLFGCAALCILGASMVILFSEQLSFIIMLIFGQVVFFVVFGFMFGLQLQVDLLTLSDELLETLRRGEGEDALGRRVAKSQRVVRSHFSGMFSVSRVIALETFDKIAEEIAGLVIGFEGLMAHSF
jgi:hypothetical protein